MKRWRNGRHRIASWRRRPTLFAPDVLVDSPSAIEAVNPLAEVIPGVDRGSAVLAAFAPLTSAPPLREIGPDPGRAHPRVALCLAKPAREVAFSDLAAWLDNLAGALGERLLRIKGLVRVNESEPPLLIESVGTMFSPPRPLKVGTARRPRPSSSSLPAM